MQFLTSNQFYLAGDSVARGHFASGSYIFSNVSAPLKISFGQRGVFYYAQRAQSLDRKKGVLFLSLISRGRDFTDNLGGRGISPSMGNVRSMLQIEMGFLYLRGNFCIINNLFLLKDKDIYWEIGYSWISGILPVEISFSSIKAGGSSKTPSNELVKGHKSPLVIG